jgi:hypothetical protein
MAGCSFEHLHANRGIGATVAERAHAQAGELAVGVAARPILEADRVTLGVDPQALLTRQRAFHRSVEEPGSKRCVRLIAHVFLAAERATVGHECDRHLFVADGETAGDVVAVVPHTLSARIHLQMPLASGVDRWHCERALRLEERVLDTLRVEHLVDDVRGCSQRCVDIAAGVLAGAEHVAGGAPHRDGRVGQHRSLRIGDWRQHVVLDGDEFRRCASLLPRVGNDDRQHVSGVAGAATDRDHHRPVLVDDADVELAGNVGGGVHRHHAGRCCRGRRIDGNDIGAAVIGEMQCRVQHAGDAHVVDVVAIAQRQSLGLVLRPTSANLARQRRTAGRALGNGVDGVKHLHVAGAPAQVRAQVARHVGALQVCTLLVDLCLGAHDDAGDAETALQSAACSEGVGERLALVGRNTFEREHVLAGHLVERLLTADDGLAVDVYGAATALAGW